VRRLTGIGAALIWIVASAACAQRAPLGPAAHTPVHPEAVFHEACDIVERDFYDPDLRGVDWDAVRERLSAQARAAATQAELSDVINDALATLATSHTTHYHPDDREYYELIDIFGLDVFPDMGPRVFPSGEIEYTTIGLIPKRIGEEVFAYDVLDGSRAEAAGVRFGDRLVSVEGEPFDAVRSFRGRAGVSTRLTVQRTPHPESRETLTVTPERIRPSDMFMRSLRESARVFERDGVRIAYARIRSYAGEKYHEAVKELVATPPLSEADALLLDIRNGWGGANPQYLNLFHQRVPTLTMLPRGEGPAEFQPNWKKPVALLVDEGTRSGKEILAFAFRRYGIGPVYGVRTAGAVTAGRPYLLSDASLLFLAVADSRIDGERIEGVGVPPDVEIEQRLRYANGRDTQLQRSLDAFAARPRKR